MTAIGHMGGMNNGPCLFVVVAKRKRSEPHFSPLEGYKRETIGKKVRRHGPSPGPEVLQYANSKRKSLAKDLGPNGTMVDVTQTATNKHWRWVWNEEPSPPEHTPSSSTPSTPGAGAVDPRFVTPSPHGFPITSPPPLERPRAQHHPLERHNAWIGDTPSIFALGNGRVLAPAANVADEADDGLSSPKADAYQMHRAGLRHSGSPGARGPRMVGPEGTIIMREHASVKPAVPVLASPFQMDISPRR